MSQLNGTTLAYIGDAVYELYIREALIEKGFHKVENLHREAIGFVSAKGQVEALDAIYELLTEEEITYFKRGRNAGSDRKPKNTDIATYKKATGFEALIGYLHLSKQFERLEGLIKVILQNKDKK